MKQEPAFMVNEFLIKDRKELEKLAKGLKERPERYAKKAVFLKEFTNELYKAYRRRPKPKREIDEKEREELKKGLKEKKRNILEKLKELKELEYLGEIPKPTVQIEKLETPAPQSKELIKSKLSGKGLVGSKIENNVYTVLEPNLTAKNKKVLEELKKEIDILTLDNEGKLKESIKVKLKEKFNQENYEILRYYLTRDLKEAGKISPLLADDRIKEIVFSNTKEPLKIIYENKEGITTNVVYPTKEEANKQIYKLANMTNKSISENDPFLDSTIKGTTIVQAMLGTKYSEPKFVIKK